MNSQYIIRSAIKSDKKDIFRFYKSQHYSARFMGLDQSYLILLDNEIIGSVIISQITPDNHQHFLHALVIHHQYRKQGLATKLLNEVLPDYQNVVCFADVSLSSFYLANKFKQTPLLEVSNRLTEQLSVRFTRYSKKKPLLNIFIRKTNNGKNS